MSEERSKVNNHWMILRCGVKVWNRWRKTNPGTRPKLLSTNLRGAYLECANLRGANLGKADLQSANLELADLRGADFWRANLGNANLQRAKLEDAYLEHANLGNANLRRAKLEDAYLDHANLGNANLQGANLQGADLENADLQHANLGRANLETAKFRNARLQGATLENADLENADLEHANLTRAYLRSARLRNATLVDAYLMNVNLENANLENACLECASLDGTFLGHADLRNTNLQAAKLFRTQFHEVDLQEARGLGQVEHLGPSSVSSQAFKKSQGQVPEVFLKGCGLEDWEILAARLHDPNLRPDEVMDIGYEVLRIRAESPIVPLSVFISYTREDERFVEKVEQQFDKDGTRSWRDVHDMVAGPVEAQVDRAIGVQRVTLLVLSERSVNSDWVVSEARRAREVEKDRRQRGEGKYVLCPVALDDSWKTCDWPRRLREQIMEYNILNFSRWGSDDEFKTQYEKLKTGLGIYYAEKGES